MRLYEYMEKDTGRGKKISYDDTIGFLSSECKIMVREHLQMKGGGIFRESYSRDSWKNYKDESIYVDTSKEKSRLSRNTLNYYTHIINSWKGWPKREVICTGGSLRAVDPSLFLIFPVDGTKIGDCGVEDIWLASTKHIGGDLNWFNVFVQGVIRAFSSVNVDKSDDNILRMKAALKEVDYNLKHESGVNLKKWKELYKLISNEAEFGFSSLNSITEWFSKAYTGDAFETLEAIINPKTLGFKLKKTGDNFGFSAQPEVWFQGKYVMVQMQLWDTKMRDDIRSYI